MFKVNNRDTRATPTFYYWHKLPLYFFKFSSKFGEESLVENVYVTYGTKSYH